MFQQSHGADALLNLLLLSSLCVHAKQSELLFLAPTRLNFGLRCTSHLLLSP
jgi:hypothetical protein